MAFLFRDLFISTSKGFKLIYLILFTLVMYPYLKAGYFMDDSQSSLFYSILKFNQISALDYAFQFNNIWINSHGRIFPINVFTAIYLWAYVFNHLIAYRIGTYFMVLGNIGLLSILLKKLKTRPTTIQLSILILLLLFQLRAYHDPIASYGLIYQVTLLMGLSSSFLLAKYIETGKIRSLLFSQGIYLFSLLFNEISLIWPILYIGISYYCFEPRKSPFNKLFVDIWKANFGFLLLAFAYAGTCFVIRSKISIEYSGTRFGLSSQFFKTFLYQMSGAFPFTYQFSESFINVDHFPYFVPGPHFMRILKKCDFWAIRSLAIFVLSAVLYLKTLLSIKSFQKKSADSCFKINQSYFFIIFFSLFLIIFPSLLISLSEKYQAEINHIGISYLPIYLSYFGVATGSALIINSFLIKAGKNQNKFIFTAICMVIATVLSSAVTLNTALNEVQVEQLNAFFKSPRNLYYESLTLGLIDEVPEGATIFHSRRILPTDRPWLNLSVGFEETGKKINFEEIDSPLFFEAQKQTSTSKPSYFLQLVSQDATSGYLILSRISHSSSDSANHKEVSKPLATIFIEGFDPSKHYYLEDRFGKKQVLTGPFKKLKKEKWASTKTPTSSLDPLSLTLGTAHAP